MLGSHSSSAEVMDPEQASVLGSPSSSAELVDPELAALSADALAWS